MCLEQRERNGYKNDKKELALEYHKKGYNCTQAVACAFCGEFGVSEEEMYKIAEGFGLGMGMMDICGALTGLFMLIGMKNSGGVEQAGKTKADTYKKTREYAAKFKEINGSVYCKELKGVETGKSLHHVINVSWMLWSSQSSS